MKQNFAGHELIWHEAKNGDNAFVMLEAFTIDLVICNAVLGRADGIDTLSKIKREYPSIPVVMLSEHDNVRNAVEALRRGASNYVVKTVTSKELVDVVLELLHGSKVNSLSRAKKSKAENVAITNTNEAYILSTSLFFLQVLKTIDLVAPTNYAVVLYGESGSGKEAFAREIHRRSPRASQAFHSIDCGTLSSELARSVLFGYEQGAFTGAAKQQKGAFEIASNGTLFLDEITNLGLDVQASLLRVIQEKKVRRIGGNEEIPIDVRIVVASNIRLIDAVNARTFRTDLFHRFNEFELNILPIRERKDDILFYAEHFLFKTNEELHKKVSHFSPAVILDMLSYNWPGNLRELRNVIRRAVLMTEDDVISDLALPIRELHPPSVLSVVEKRTSAGEGVQQVEQEYRSILSVLQQNGFNKRNAAKVLNIDVKSLATRLDAFAKMKGFKLEF